MPAAVLFGGLFGFAFVLTVLYSFWQVIDYRVAVRWTLGNYRYFLSVPGYLHTLWATVWMAGVATVCDVVIALPAAYWLTRYVAERARRAVIFVVILPFLTSYLLRIFAWISILGENGAINRLLRWTGLIHGSLSFLLYDRPAVVLVLVSLYLPFAVLVLYSGFESFDWRQVAAAADLGATPLRSFALIVLPQVRVALGTAVVFIFIPILGEYLTPQLIGGVRGAMTGNIIVNFFDAGEYTRGAAACLLITACIVVLLVVFRRSLEVSAPESR